MARIHSPGVGELHVVASISDVQAPTTTELNLGVDLTEFSRGEPNIPETGNTADISDLSSKFNKRDGASYGGDTLTLELYRDDTTDTAYDTLTRALLTNVIWCANGLATAGTFAIGDDVWVYPARVISRAKGQPGRDEDQFFIASIAIIDDHNEKYALLS